MVRQISPEAVRDKLAASEPVVLLDVRQPEEHAHCRLPGSQLIPLGELARRAGEVEVPDGATVVVYCHHGVRSLTGAMILHQAGVAGAASMAGGIEAWSVRIDPAVPRY